MYNTQEPSVDTLRRESERTRAELAQTVSELRGRVSDTASEIKTMASPAYIKQEIRTFVREERESLRQSIERKVRENPLQAAAVAAAIGYPALGLLRAIPMPLMLIGAGLFLTSSRGKETLADATAKANEMFDRGVAKASEMASDLGDAVSQRTEPLTQALDEAGNVITEKTDALASGIRRNVHDLRDAASDAAERVSATVGAAQEKVAAEFDNARSQASVTADPTKSVLMDWVDRNPLAVAGIGAAIGAFIAAALPPSSVENRVMGAGSDALKDRVREATGDGLAKAKAAASDIADDVQAAAAREGLDPDSVAQTADNLSQGVRKVAERGVKTALNGLKEVSDAPDTPASQTH
jgi:ElaB/YqjD/DUF883 family membrane-anchored ribosome-binding protein